MFKLKKGANGVGVNDNVTPQTDISQAVAPVEGQSEQVPFIQELVSKVKGFDKN